MTHYFSSLRNLLFRTLLAACCLFAAGHGHAQPSGVLAALSQYAGADRERMLLEGARKEGGLTLYTSIAQKDIPPLLAGFEKKYGIKVQVWRAASDKVLQRTLTETSGKRFEVDAIHVGAPELEALRLENVLQSVRTPASSELLPGAVPAHREWVATRLTVFVQAFNTQQIKREALPRTWQDLTDPKWKGKLGIELTDDEWFHDLVQQLGEERGLKLFRDIVATNGLSVRKGHTLLAQLVASGEVPLALTVYSYMAETIKKSGAPIDWFVLDPAITRVNGMGIARQAPHPHAALLFYDYVISVEAQKTLAAMDYIPTNALVESPIKNIKLNAAHLPKTTSQSEKWERLYQQTLSPVKN